MKRWLLESCIGRPRALAIVPWLGAMAAAVGFCADAAFAEETAAGYRLAPKAFRSAVARVLPSVVTIEAFGGIGPSAGRTRRGPTSGISQPGDGPTTGLIVSADGFIVTSTFNFIRKPPIITVVLSDGTQKVARLVGRDEIRKLCLLKIDGVANLPVPDLAPRQSLRVGQWAVTVGVGYGNQEPAISAGILSATSRISGHAVQTDANISPANYGGPLVDLDGRAIGVCVPITPQSTETAGGVEWYDSGIGFAIPLAGGEAWIARLKNGETIEPGRMGVRAKPAAPDGSGAVVDAVVPRSPAEKVGIQKGDRIEKLGGEVVQDVARLMSLVGRYAKGDKVQVVLRRGEKEITVEVTMDKVVEPPPQARRPRLPERRPPGSPRPPEPD